MSVNELIMGGLYLLCAFTWGVAAVVWLKGTRPFELSLRAVRGLAAVALVAVIVLSGAPAWLVLPVAMVPPALAGAVSWTRHGHAPAIVERVARGTGWGDIG